MDQVHADFLGQKRSNQNTKATIFLIAKLLLHRRVINARRVRDDEASD